MTAAHLSSPPRQAAVFAALVGLHVGVFVLIAIGLVPRRLWLEQPQPPVILLPPVQEPVAIAAPPASGPTDYSPPRQPIPLVEIPVIDAATPVTGSPGHVSDAGAGAGPALPTAETVAPSLRAPGSRLAALIDACYPFAARRRGEEGRVVVEVSIDAAGRVAAWNVVQGSGFRRLDGAVDCVLRRLEFLPGSRDGRAVPSSVLLPVQFRLD
jgi:protein TonB